MYNLNKKRGTDTHVGWMQLPVDNNDPAEDKETNWKVDIVTDLLND